MNKEITNNNYNNEYKTTVKEDFDLVKEMAAFAGATKKEVIDAKEQASKARIDGYTNEKANAQNNMYEEYMNQSIKDNFETKTKLMEEKLKLMEDIANSRYTLKQLEIETELKKKQLISETEIQQKQIIAEYDIKINKKKEELAELNKKGKMTTFNKIFWPLLGVITGVAVFCLLYIIK